MIAGKVVALAQALVAAGAFEVLAPVEAQTPVPPVRREYPLNCRGGAGLVFDTLLVEPDSNRVRLMLTFAANTTPSGLEGQGLQPGSCAWVDRALSDAEPRRIQLTIGTSDVCSAAYGARQRHVLGLPRL